MFTWILENIATLTVSGILIVAVTAVIVNMVHNRKKGESSCGCGCGDCSLYSSCHPRNTHHEDIHS